MRILTLCYEWPPVGGGGGRAARDIAEGLAKRGHSLRVQTIRFGRSPRFAKEQAVDVYRTSGFRRRADRCSPAEMAGYIVTSGLPTLRHLHEFKPDLIHAHFAVPTGALALPSAILGRIPYVLTAHLGDVPGAIPDQTDHLFNWIQPFVRPIWKRASAIVGVSQFVADLAQRAYGRAVQVIPNGIRLNDRPAAPDISQAPPQLIFVGRLNSQKNLRYLPPVLSAVNDLPWRLTIVGDGDERSALENDFRQAGLMDRVTFRGWLDRIQVEAAVAASDIFLMPSLVEGLSVAALEALKFGLIILGSDIPALRDCIDQGKSGFLLPLAQPDHWIETLRNLINSPDRRVLMRRAAWEFGSKFGLDLISQQYENLFRRIVSDR
jgi:glycogen synthase